MAVSRARYSNSQHRLHHGLVCYANSQRDLLILETQSLDDSRQEILESVRGKMHMLHEDE